VKKWDNSFPENRYFVCLGIMGCEYAVGIVLPPLSMVTPAWSSQPDEDRVCVSVSGFHPFILAPQ